MSHFCGKPIVTHQLKNTGDALENESSPVLLPASSEYFNYSLTPEKDENDLRQALPDLPVLGVPSHSKPVALKPLLNAEGKVKGYRVTGTLRPKTKPSKAEFSSYDDALAQQAAWETERIHGLAGLRPKITHLTQSQLRESEAAFKMLEGIYY